MAEPPPAEQPTPGPTDPRCAPRVLANAGHLAQHAEELGMTGGSWSCATGESRAAGTRERSPPPELAVDGPNPKGRHAAVAGLIAEGIASALAPGAD